MKNYEYLVKSFPCEAVECYILSSFDRDWWELVSVVDDIKKYGMLKLFFRREIIKKQTKL